MLKRISLSLLVGLFVLSPIANASIGGKSVVIETQPKAFVPSVSLKNVSGTFSDVTSVKIILSDAENTELKLIDMGNKTWETKLSPEQIKALLGDKKSESYSAKLIIRSKNDKGLPNLKTETIQIVIDGGSSL